MPPEPAGKDACLTSNRFSASATERRSFFAHPSERGLAELKVESKGLSFL